MTDRPTRPGGDLDVLAVLADLAACPTAPFHEAWIAQRIGAHLTGLGLPPTADPWGNLIVRVRRGEGAPPVALVAHMDHPGFEIVEAAEDGAPRAGVLGGLIAPLFTGEPTLRFYPAGPDRPQLVRVVACVEAGPRERYVTLDASGGTLPPGSFGVLDLPDLVRQGELLYLRAADDVVGCAAIVAALARIAAGSEPCDVWGVFTRAEEVGLIGATLLARARTLPAETLVVSLETSKALPGAEIGGGPVIRVGDISSAFHPEGDALLQQAGDRVRAAGGLVQRQLMSGGTCEATTFNRHGYRATGISIPLGNYHNRTPEDRIGAEYVHAADVRGCVDLLSAIPAAAADPTPDERAQRFALMADRYDARLRESAGAFGRAEPHA